MTRTFLRGSYQHGQAAQLNEAAAATALVHHPEKQAFLTRIAELEAEVTRLKLELIEARKPRGHSNSMNFP